MSRSKSKEPDVVFKKAKKKKAKGGKKNRKHGRDKKKCEAYRLTGKREQNKKRKAEKRDRKLAKRKFKRAE